MGRELLWSPFVWMWVASSVMIGMGWRWLWRPGGERGSRRLATAAVAVAVGGAFLFFMSLPIIAYTLLAVFG